MDRNEARAMIQKAVEIRIKLIAQRVKANDAKLDKYLSRPAWCRLFFSNPQHQMFWRLDEEIQNHWLEELNQLLYAMDQYPSFTPAPEKLQELAIFVAANET